ncbi:MAG: hypothetical protein ACM3OC_08760, partial [Deltaproteobacteria bacterium]
MVNDKVTDCERGTVYIYLTTDAEASAIAPAADKVDAASSGWVTLDEELVKYALWKKNGWKKLTLGSGEVIDYASLGFDILSKPQLVSAIKAYAALVSALNKPYSLLALFMDKDKTLTGPNQPIDADMTDRLVEKFRQKVLVAIITGGLFRHSINNVIRPVEKAAGPSDLLRYFRYYYMGGNGKAVWREGRRNSILSSMKFSAHDQAVITRAYAVATMEQIAAETGIDASSYIKEAERAVSAKAVTGVFNTFIEMNKDVTGTILINNGFGRIIALELIESAAVQSAPRFQRTDFTEKISRRMEQLMGDSLERRAVMHYGNTFITINVRNKELTLKQFLARCKSPDILIIAVGDSATDYDFMSCALSRGRRVSLLVGDPGKEGVACPSVIEIWPLKGPEGTKQILDVITVMKTQMKDGGFNILCVCNFNFSRSATMDMIISDLIKRNGLENRINVDSGGAKAEDPKGWGRTNTEFSGFFVKYYGKQPKRIISKKLTAEMVAKADLILAADASVKSLLVANKDFIFALERKRILLESELEQGAVIPAGITDSEEAAFLRIRHAIENVVWPEVEKTTLEDGGQEVQIEIVLPDQETVEKYKRLRWDFTPEEDMRLIKGLVRDGSLDRAFRSIYPKEGVDGRVRGIAIEFAFHNLSDVYYKVTYEFGKYSKSLFVGTKGYTLGPQSKFLSGKSLSDAYADYQKRVHDLHKLHYGKLRLSAVPYDNVLTMIKWYVSEFDTDEFPVPLPVMVVEFLEGVDCARLFKIARDIGMQRLILKKALEPYVLFFGLNYEDRDSGTASASTGCLIRDAALWNVILPVSPVAVAKGDIRKVARVHGRIGDIVGINEDGVIGGWPVETGSFEDFIRQMQDFRGAGRKYSSMNGILTESEREALRLDRRIVVELAREILNEQDTFELNPELKGLIEKGDGGVTVSHGQIVGETVRILAEHIRTAAGSMDDEQLRRFISALASTRLMLIGGVGRSGLAASFSENRLIENIGLTGVRVVEMGDEGVTRYFGRSKFDVFLAISSSGSTRRIKEYTRIMREQNVRVLAITSNPKGEAWDGSRDIILNVKGRTKADWKLDSASRLGRRTPLGTLSEFTTVVLMSSMIQAVSEERFSAERVKEIMLTVASELEDSVAVIEAQDAKLQQCVDKLLSAREQQGKVVLDGTGRVRKIFEMFAARLIQVYGFNPLVMRGFVSAKIRKEVDAVLACTLSGEVQEILETVNHAVNDKRITPVLFTAPGASPARELIDNGEFSAPNGKFSVKGAVVGVDVNGSAVRAGRLKCWTHEQFKYLNFDQPARADVLENTSEFILLAMLDGLFACVMERLDLDEEDLEHAELEDGGDGLRKDYLSDAQWILAKDGPAGDLSAMGQPEIYAEQDMVYLSYADRVIRMGPASYNDALTDTLKVRSVFRNGLRADIITDREEVALIKHEIALYKENPGLNTLVSWLNSADRDENMKAMNQLGSMLAGPLAAEAVRLLNAALGHHDPAVQRLAQSFLNNVYSSRPVEFPGFVETRIAMLGQEISFTPAQLVLPEAKAGLKARIVVADNHSNSKKYLDLTAGRSPPVLTAEKGIIHTALQVQAASGEWEYVTGAAANQLIFCQPDLRGQMVFQAWVALCGGFKEIEKLIPQLQKTGYRYIYLMGIFQLDDPKNIQGNAGNDASLFSPLELSISKELGGEKEFTHLLKKLHAANIEPIVDLIPHVNRNSVAFSERAFVKANYLGMVVRRLATDGSVSFETGTPLPTEWHDSVMLNWRDNYVLEQYVSKAKWLAGLGVKGLRIDVAHNFGTMLPVEPSLSGKPRLFG